MRPGDPIDKQPYIEVNVGVGIYDINNPEFDEKDFKHGSCNPCFILDDKYVWVSDA